MEQAKKPANSGSDKPPTDPTQYPSYQAKLKGQQGLVDFLERFSNWEPWVEGDLPAYSIPDELIHLLGPAEGRAKRLLTQDEVEAELAFGKLCLAWNKLCVGVWRRKPICHFAVSDFKSDSRPPTESEDLEPESSAFAPIAEIKDRLFGLHPGDFVGRAKMLGYWGGIGIPRGSTEEIDFRHATRGCIGSLLCDPGFVDDIQSLQLLWTKLPANLQLPIGDPLTDRDKLVLVAKNKGRNVALACVDFSIEYQRILERWALSGFVTWDLPLIQPPLLGIPLFQAAEILPCTARVIYWPPHVQRPSTLDFNAILRSVQHTDAAFRQYTEEQSARSTFPSVPGKQKGGRPSDNEKIARMLLWERALVQRYPDRGRSSRFVEAIEALFNLNSLQAAKNVHSSYRHLFPKPNRK